MQQYSIYEGTINLRSDSQYVIKEGYEKYDGMKVKLEALRLIEREDSKLYAGEWAMRVIEPEEWDRGWIASGDIFGLKIVNNF